jgi:RNA polymerase sigma-B factor
MMTEPRGTTGGPTRTQSSTPDPERVSELLREYVVTRDLALRNRLVLLHEPLARRIAARFGNSGGTMNEDLRQVAFLGLIVALERYDPSREVSFVTYAAATMVGVIKHYLRDHGWLLKAPRRLRELGMTLRKVRGRLEHELGRSPTISELSAAAEVDEERVLEAMDVDSNYQVASLDVRLGEDAGDQVASRLEVLGEPDPHYEAIDARESMRIALDRLAPREREIIFQRFFHESSQSEVAAHLKISQMHVSRLERRALERLRAILS